jgi:hypothetical protein
VEEDAFEKIEPCVQEIQNPTGDIRSELSRERGDGWAKDLAVEWILADLPSGAWSYRESATLQIVRHQRKAFHDPIRIIGGLNIGEVRVPTRVVQEIRTHRVTDEVDQEGIPVCVEYVLLA